MSQQQLPDASRHHYRHFVGREAEITRFHQLLAAVTLFVGRIAHHPTPCSRGLHMRYEGGMNWAAPFAAPHHLGYPSAMKQQDVGPALKRLRAARGLSVAELAERCQDVSAQQVRRAEKDSRPLLDTLGRLLEGLDANLCDLHSAIVDPHWQPPAPAPEAPPLPSLLTRPELVGMAVQLLRRRANLTLQNLGDLLGMSKSGAGDIEKGSNFRLSSFERVLEVLNASLLDFHEALQMAHFASAWQQGLDDEAARLRGGLLSLQLPHLGSRDEGETEAALRSLRQRVPPRTSQ